MPEPAPHGSSFDSGMQITLADDQPLHGLKERHVRAGIGVPVVVTRQRRASRDDGDPLSMASARARTAIVGVERGFDARVRLVRVQLVDPDAKNSIRLRGVELPLAADYTAPLAYMLGLERRPAGTRHDVIDPAARGTYDGFTPLTPFSAARTPLILVEGAGLSPLMMAQVANEVVGDASLRARFQVWLYRYPMTAPLFFTAGRLRVDLEKFYARLDASSGGPADAAVVIAQGPSALLGRSLLLDTGASLWDAVFASNPDTTSLRSADRRLLDSVIRWHAAPRIREVIAVGTPDNLGATAAGVGERAVQLLLMQPHRFTSAIERIYATVGRSLRARTPAGTDHAEALHQAIHDAAVAAERALLVRLAPGGEGAAAALYGACDATQPRQVLDRIGDGSPLGLRAMRQVQAWLRASSGRTTA
jgi:hypothetical protein